MRSIMRIAVVVLAAGFFIVGCRNAEPPDRKNAAIGSYRQDLRTSTALLVVEWNGEPKLIGSGFLVEKEKGIFMTAKHVTDAAAKLRGDDKLKLFFNGAVYEVFVMKVLPVCDAVLVAISGKFDPSMFPAAYAAASSGARKGDVVYIQGFHWHPFAIRKLNDGDGAPDIVVPIMESYYQLISKDPARETEFVFDRLEGSVMKVGTKIEVENEDAADIRKLAHDTNIYFQVRTKRNHRFSFGGLSGGPALNEKGEFAGVVTAEDVARWEPILPPSDPRERKGTTFSIKSVADTLYVTPVSSVKDLLEYAHRAK
ncbi:MAG: trypsin-like peptidase domain-containing protein [Candidatus Liptonbacteria bacterium]|nr:trypsin-like peptidase domain-containing protein [Candidatus Liptonbacteria bacterium]